MRLGLGGFDPIKVEPRNYPIVRGGNNSNLARFDINWFRENIGAVPPVGYWGFFRGMILEYYLLIHLQPDPLDEAVATAGRFYWDTQALCFAWKERIIFKVKTECFNILGQ